MENKEEYYDCFISSNDYYRLMEVPAFLVVSNYPIVEFAIDGELGKIGIGYKRFLRFFLQNGQNNGQKLQ